MVEKINVHTRNSKSNSKSIAICSLYARICTEMPRSVKGVSEAINSLVENIFGEIMDGSLALKSAAGGGSQGLDSLTPLYT